MKISSDFPPVWPALQKHFPGLEKYRPIATYGDTIYNPFGVYIDPSLMAHEEKHMRQQMPLTDRPELYIQIWWENYLKYPEFRLSQELEAYRAQYAYAKAHYNRAQCRQLLDFISSALSSSLYGNLITKQQAKERIIYEESND